MGVAASTCSGCTGVTPLYTPSKSAMDEHVTASTMYADMSGWSGEVFEDQVTLTGLPVVVQDFVAISTQTSFFQKNMYQGILGFGPSDLEEPATTGLMDLEANAGVPYEMAFRMCPTTGDLWIGGFDPTAAASAVAYTPILPLGSNDPFYTVQIADMGFGSDDLGFTTADFGITLVDTGTSVSEIPSPVETAMLNNVNANSAFMTFFPSQTIADTENGDCVMGSGVTSEMVDAMLPPLVISFPAANNVAFKVTLAPSKSYLAPLGSGMFCWGFTSSGSDASMTVSLIGDTSLAGMLTVFDVAHNQLGFASEQGCPEADIALHPNVVRAPSLGAAPATGHWYEQDPFYHAPPRARRATTR